MGQPRGTWWADGGKHVGACNSFCSYGCKHVGACNSLKPQILVFFMFHMYMWVSQGVLGRQIATVYRVVSMLVHVTA